MAKGGFQSRGGRGGMPGGINMNMIKQAQKMQQDMLKAQEEVAAQEFSASAGGGMVTAVVSGERTLLRLDIDADAIIDAQSEEDAEMLSDAVIAAVNEAMKKAEEAMGNTVSKFTGGLNLGF